MVSVVSGVFSVALGACSRASYQLRNRTNLSLPISDIDLFFDSYINSRHSRASINSRHHPPRLRASGFGHGPGKIKSQIHEYDQSKGFSSGIPGGERVACPEQSAPNGIMTERIPSTRANRVLCYRLNSQFGSSRCRAVLDPSLLAQAAAALTSVPQPKGQVFIWVRV